jgi:hypothetical protein
MIYIGIDDTDNLDSRGTGHLARQIAVNLADEFYVLGVVRHQLLVDPRVPCTKNNSCASILLGTPGQYDLHGLQKTISQMMRADFQTGSDPGLCIADGLPKEVTSFGRRAQREIVTQAEARQIASQFDILLEGLGGTEDGVIGALSAAGLAACGDDGRYVSVGTLRELSGLQPVQKLLEAGITKVCKIGGEPVLDGLVLADKLRPARRVGQPILFVEWQDDHWLPLKLD